MLNSPLKLSSGNRSWDYQLSDGVTMLRGIPVTDHISQEVPYLNADIDAGDKEFDLVAHGFVEGDPITFREDGGLQTGQSATYTYYVIYVDADHFQIARYFPGNSELTLTADATGTNYIQRRKRAKYILPVNYGATPVGIRPTNDPTYSMDTDVEMVLHHLSAHAIPLDVTGFSIIAAESIGGDGDLRVAALENE
jgi:hypothetical protein